MTDIALGRTAVADALTAVLPWPCLPYPVESFVPPGAFVDVVRVTFEGGSAAWFCSGAGTFTIATVELRNDLPGALASLETHIPAVIKAIQQLQLVVMRVDSGILSVGGADLPAVSYQVQGRI